MLPLVPIHDNLSSSSSVSSLASIGKSAFVVSRGSMVI